MGFFMNFFFIHWFLESYAHIHTHSQAWRNTIFIAFKMISGYFFNGISLSVVNEMQILFVCGKYHQTRERRPWQCSEWTGGLLLLVWSLGENFHLWTCSGGFFADREMVHTSHAWGKLACGFSCRICYTEECSGYWGFEAVLHLPVTKDYASISWHICGVWVSPCSLKAQPTDIVEMRGEFVLLSPHLPGSQVSVILHLAYSGFRGHPYPKWSVLERLLVFLIFGFLSTFIWHVFQSLMDIYVPEWSISLCGMDVLFLPNKLK